MNFSKEAPDKAWRPWCQWPWQIYLTTATPALRFWQATCDFVLAALCQLFTAIIHVYLHPDPPILNCQEIPGSQARAPILMGSGEGV